MPNHIGAFLKASKCFSELGINITRVSYNKAVDSHTLFIEVDADEKQFEKANEKLKEINDNTMVQYLLTWAKNKIKYFKILAENYGLNLFISFLCL